MARAKKPKSDGNVIVHGALKAKRAHARANKILRECLDEWAQGDKKNRFLMRNDAGEISVAYHLESSVEWGDLAGWYTPKRDVEHWLEGAEKMFNATSFTSYVNGQSVTERPAEDWEWTAEDWEWIIETTARVAMSWSLTILFENLAAALKETTREAEQFANMTLRSMLSGILERDPDVGDVQINPRMVIEGMIKDSIELQRARLVALFAQVPHVRPVRRGRPKRATKRNIEAATKRRGERARQATVADDLGLHKRTLGKQVAHMGFDNWRHFVKHCANQQSANIKKRH